MPTIKDIARAAGVSHGTVSNVLNKTGKVSIEKILLVEEAAKKLGYVPNAQAQLLRQGVPDLVAIVLPNLRDSIYLDLYTALQISFQSYGYETALYITGDIASTEEKIIKNLPLSRIAALVAVSCLRDESAHLYNSFSFPIIFAERKIELTGNHISFFTFDLQAAGYSLGKYILDQGWKSVAFFSAPSYFENANRIFSGFSDALNNTAVFVQKFTSDTNLILNKAFDIIHENQNLDAIITTCSERANMLSTALQFSENRKKPAIITIDSFRPFSNPHYKTFELDYSQMGARIAETVSTHLHKNTDLPHQYTMPCKGFPFSYPFISKGIPQSLTMLTLGSPGVSALEKLSTQFEQRTGISLKITSMPYDDLYEHIQLLNSDFYYDLIRIDLAWLDSMGPLVYKPLKSLGLDTNGFLKELTSSPENDYSLPFDPSVQIFLYRTDLFSDATLCRAYYERYREALAIPKNTDQYLRVAEFFTRESNPHSPTIYGATSTCGMAITASCDFMPFYLEGLETSQEKTTFGITKLADALQKYSALFQYTNKQQSLWWQDSIRGFADGDTATATTFSNHAAYLINSKRSNVVGRTGAAILPGGHPLLGGGVIGVSRYSRQEEACRQFFQWFYSNDIASAVVRLGGTSPLTNVYNDFENHVLFPWLPASRESLKVGTRGGKEVPVGKLSIRQYENIIGIAVRNVINKKMTPLEAAENAQRIFFSQIEPD
ncbi:extracellular solute-binding protein [Clostridium sp. HBUAS56010]|uniref:extracellular solute-binding protein n=1 Tax=Clostridium sp. HBUAS56010 TaxID=2571127 RepID=UPI0011788567|nr:extracellular solute-binding protein [Clostridium sp. HBUAS56010]